MAVGESGGGGGGLCVRPLRVGPDFESSHGGGLAAAKVYAYYTHTHMQRGGVGREGESGRGLNQRARASKRERGCKGGISGWPGGHNVGDTFSYQVWPLWWHDGQNNRK